MTTDKERAAAIAALNDAFRTGFRPALGRIMITSGAREAVAAWPLGELGLYEKVRAFTAFTADNDPYGEHDFGSVEYAEAKFYFKIDYYQRGSNFSLGSETPDDAATTERVMTIMLASDY